MVAFFLFLFKLYHFLFLNIELELYACLAKTTTELHSQPSAMPLTTCIELKLFSKLNFKDDNKLLNCYFN